MDTNESHFETVHIKVEDEDYSDEEKWHEPEFQEVFLPGKWTIVTS